MRVKFFIDEQDESAKVIWDRLRKERSSNGYLVADTEDLEPYFRYNGYPQELPKILEGVKFVRVVLEDDNDKNFPREGRYRRGTTQVVVDTGFGYSATRMWYMVVSGKSLKAVLSLYDDIRTGKVQPAVDWGALDRKALMNVPLLELELSARGYNALSRDRIRTVGELMSKTEDYLLTFVPGFGKRCLKEVKDALGSRGLTLNQGN